MHAPVSAPPIKPTAPAAPSLLTLVRLATSAEDPSWTRGAVRLPPTACGTPLWKTSALLGCLLLTAGRRTAPGTAPDLPPRFLDRDFGRAGVLRYEDVDFPAALTHEPTRRFLTETGLPLQAHPFTLDTAPYETPLPTLEEYAEAEPAAMTLPEGACLLIRLGRLADGTHVLVDGTTGATLTWHGTDATLHPLTSDVPSLALSLWALRRGEALGTAASA
ncbi:SUKH-4 family immunity protein [Streptomyces sp. CRN 30]|uniref:SUKH-4 family immunity protein n=1 Tax=Streptomyces sp. CRN 30 TaxID=3075613 RepID=UPI002A7FC1B0|nr:SUKH-4 family immunity protein [Streptomyces sp. CRN 30]